MGACIAVSWQDLPPPSPSPAARRGGNVPVLFGRDQSDLSFRQSSFAPETFTICAHFEVSRLISAENSSGELEVGSYPWSIKAA
jgi:hypothetical protein